MIGQPTKFWMLEQFPTGLLALTVLLRWRFLVSYRWTKIPVAPGIIDITGFDPSIWSRCVFINDANTLLVISPVCPPFNKKVLHGAHGLLVKPL